MHIPYSVSAQKVEKFKEVLTKQDKTVPVCLLHDDDADGICAGVIMYHTLQRLGFEQIMFTPKAKERPLFTSKQLREFSQEGSQLIICVDFEPLSWNFIDEKRFEQLQFDLCVLDHHFDQSKAYEKPNERVRLFLHPSNTANCNNPSQYCASKFVFDVCSHIVDLSDIEWKILPGMIGDMNVIEWEEYIVAKAKEFNVKIDTTDRLAYFTSSFGEFSAIVTFASSKSANDIENLFEMYIQAKNITEALQIGTKYKDIETEYYRLLTHWKEYAVLQDNMYVVQFVSPHMLTSALSSNISYADPQMMFFMYQANGEGYCHISMRAQQSRVHLGKLLQFVASHFENSRGGGHKPAAGAICMEKDIDAFIQKIKDHREDFTE